MNEATDMPIAQCCGVEPWEYRVVLRQPQWRRSGVHLESYGTMKRFPLVGSMVHWRPDRQHRSLMTLKQEGLLKMKKVKVLLKRRTTATSWNQRIAPRESGMQGLFETFSGRSGGREHTSIMNFSMSQQRHHPHSRAIEIPSLFLHTSRRQSHLGRLVESSHSPTPDRTASIGYQFNLISLVPASTVALLHSVSLGRFSAFR
jgi:hypothetical protein